MKISCNEVLDLMVDYIEGSLDKNLSLQIEAHLEECTSCALEYTETKALLSETHYLSANNDKANTKYFEQLKNNIIKNIEQNEAKLCENTQERLMFFEPLDSKMKEHLKKCPSCQQLAKESEIFKSLLSEISIEMPKENFFKSQISRITWRLNYEERVERISFKQLLNSLKNTFEYFIRPTSLLVMSGTLAILLVLNVMFLDHTPKEQKILYLSDLLNKTRIESKAKDIPSPSYEQKLNIEATGTAKAKTKKTKRI